MRPCKKCGSTAPTRVLKEEPMVGPYCDGCFGAMTQEDIDDELNLIKGIKKLFPTTWMLPTDEAKEKQERGIY